MFLWKNAIVVIVLLALACVPVLALARSNRERASIAKFAYAAVVITCISLSFLPMPLCQMIFGILLLLCIDQRMPMVATYLFFSIWTPAAASYLVVGGAYFVPLRPILSFSIALWVGYLLNPGMRLKRRFNATDGWLLAFLLIYCFCMTLRDVGAAFARNFINYVLPYWLSYHVVSRTRIERPELVLRVFALVAAATGLICFFESVRHWPLYNGLGPLKGYWVMVDTPNIMLIRSGLFRSYGPYAHPLTASAVLGIGGISVFALACLRGFTAPVIAIGAVTLLGLFATVSRTGIVALAIGIMAIQVLRRRYGGVAIVTIIGLFVMFGLPFLSSQDAQNNGAYRLMLVTGVPKAMGTRLILGYREAVSTGILDAFIQGEGIVDLVNVYLAIVVNGGIVSLLPYLIFLGCTWTQYRALLRLSPDREQLILAQACVGMQAGIMAAGMFMGAWTTAMLISMLCVAIIVALRAEIVRAAKGKQLAAPRPVMAHDPLLPMLR